MAEQSLKNKTVKGVGWSAIDNIAGHGVTFVVSIVLARLLTPEHYGLIGIITIFTAVCQTLINAGFTTALIRKKDATDSDYNTVFIVNLVMSMALYAVIFLCAPEFIERLEKIQWWNWPDDALRENIDWLIHSDINEETVSKMEEISETTEINSYVLLCSRWQRRY